MDEQEKFIHGFTYTYNAKKFREIMQEKLFLNTTLIFRFMFKYF
jgi:hypothetical protein